MSNNYFKYMGEAQIKENREMFTELLHNIRRPGADIEGLIKALDSRDFFTAPATTQYAYSDKGGLCEFSLNICEKFKLLLDKGVYEAEFPAAEDIDSTIYILGLLSQLGKMNYFESYIQNKKVYTPGGSKYDSMGNFEWESQQSYKIREADNRFVFGTRGQNAEFIVRQFIPLTVEESAALINCSEEISTNTYLPEIWDKYPLAATLHCAIVMAMYCITERPLYV